MGSEEKNTTWNSTKATLLFQKLDAVIGEVETWRYQIEQAYAKKDKALPPLSGDLVNRLREHNKTFVTKFVISGHEPIYNAIRSLNEQMAKSPELLSEKAASGSKNPNAGHQRNATWDRSKTIQFLKKLQDIIRDVETWYRGVTEKINNGKNLAPLTHTLWAKLTEHNASIAEIFGVKKGVQELTAIKSAMQELCTNIEKFPKMFSKNPGTTHDNARCAGGAAPEHHAPQESTRSKTLRHDQQGQGDIQRREHFLAEREIKVQQNERQLNEYSKTIEARIGLMEGEVERLQNKNRELTEQLSHQMHTKISANEQNLENISIKNRPVNIAEEYQSLMSHEWMNAMEELRNKKMKAAPAHLFLHTVLMTAESKAAEHHLDLVQRIKAPLGLKSRPKSASAKGKIPQATLNGLGDYWRLTADDADLKGLVQMIGEEIAKAETFAKICDQAKQFPNFQIFSQKAALLGWKMVLQRPKMAFKSVQEGSTWDKRTQDVFFESADPVRYPVIYSIGPALFHGDQLMVKAKVVCGEQSRQ